MVLRRKVQWFVDGCGGGLLAGGILYFIVYITVCRGWGGVVVMYTIENQHLHLGGGASEKEDSASPREDKILPRTCICFLDDTPPLNTA